VSGKLALVRPNPTIKVPAQVSAAQNAGAVGLLLANDKPGVLDPSAGSNVRIPVIGLSQADGDRIRAALGSDRSTRLLLSGTDPRHSPFLYDLVKPWPGQIPGSLRYTVGSDDVATLPTDYAASYPGQPGRELRHHWRPGAVASIAYGRDLILPLHRVDYVSASDSVWQQTVRLAPPSSAELVETTRGYPRGQREQRSWFKGPIAAGPQSGAPSRPERGTPVNRRDNTLFVSMPEFRDSDPTHAGDFQSWIDTGRATIRRDGVEIHTGSTLDGKYVVPAETGTYEFELDVSRGGDFWRTSTRSHTRWTLRSGRPATLDPVPLPLVDARVSVPVDSLNRVPGLATIPVTVTAGHQAGAPTVALREVTLAVSYDDGVTWRNVRLAKQKDGRYEALLHLPGSGFGTLRVNAIDVEGNAFDQTIYRSYEVVSRPE
jgi:hypothetical protein